MKNLTIPKNYEIPEKYNNQPEISLTDNNRLQSYSSVGCSEIPDIKLGNDSQLTIPGGLYVFKSIELTGLSDEII